MQSSAKMPSPSQPAAHPGLVRLFTGHVSGNVAILFGLMIIPLFAAGGAALDYGVAHRAKGKMQTALDAAALAAGRVWQVNQDAAAAETAARISFREQKPTDVQNDISYFNLDRTTNVLTMRAEGLSKTPFVSVLGIRGYHINARAEARLAVGGNAEKSLEIAMMLDVTGSMSGQKINDLKSAAKDLIDIVVWDDQSQHTSRVALVPFSQSINLGPYFDAVTGESRNSLYVYPWSCFEDTGDVKGICYHKPEYLVPNASYSGCVVERGGPQAFNDHQPVARAFRPLEDFSGSTCKPGVSVMPMSNSRNALKAHIDLFPAEGRTAGHLGTAWAWYMLSPRWNGVWPAASQAAAYGDTRVMKIALLMTDGEYNQEYRRDENGNSTSQARQLCANMKAEGITVYTIGFQLGDQTAIDTLSQCASSGSHVYLAGDGDALRRAFRDIALKLANLRLSR